MHAKSGSWADRLTHINALHVKHHIDTQKDMTMKDGFSLDALYFHLPNTAVQVAVGATILGALDYGLALEIPSTWVLASSAAFAASHSALWNTMHLDMHEAREVIKDGIPSIDYDRRGMYVQWVFDNHTTHHDVGGGMNYNVVCPGPDLILGTYLQRNSSVRL